MKKVPLSEGINTRTTSTDAGLTASGRMERWSTGHLTGSRKNEKVRKSNPSFHKSTQRCTMKIMLLSDARPVNMRIVSRHTHSVVQHLARLAAVYLLPRPPLDIQPSCERRGREGRAPERDFSTSTANSTSASQLH